MCRSSFPEFFEAVRVLEVGSLDVNGSVRELFESCDYTGIDVGPGPGVDVVVSGQDYDAPDGSFDVVISAECMEHNPAWVATIENMIRLLRPDGLFVLTCAAPGRREHGTARSEPSSSPLTVQLGQDYYRNLSPSDIVRAGALSGLGLVASWMNWRVRDTYLVGFKASSPPTGWSHFIADVGAWMHEKRRDGGRLPDRIALGLLGGRGYDCLVSWARSGRDKARALRQRLGRAPRGA